MMSWLQFKRPAPAQARAYRQGQTLLISGRFRSGSTLLWQLLRASKDTVAFYEPDHDGLLAHIANTMPMPSHVGVQRYWDEYAGREALLASHHQADFGSRDFLLEAHDERPALADFLQALAHSCAPRRAVLKLNRFSLRLPWLRAHLPDARILHLTREPRAAWFSSRRHLPAERWDASCELDAYDLLQWTLDLAPKLPFLASLLDRPSYSLHFALWRLSDLLGERLADFQLHLERDVHDPLGLGLERMVRAQMIDASEVTALRALIVKPRDFELPHSANYFDSLENEVNSWLDELGLSPSFGLEPLARIRQRHLRAWRRFEPLNLGAVIAPLLQALSAARAEQTRLLRIVRELESTR